MTCRRSRPLAVACWCSAGLGVGVRRRRRSPCLPVGSVRRLTAGRWTAVTRSASQHLPSRVSRAHRALCLSVSATCQTVPAQCIVIVIIIIIISIKYFTVCLYTLCGSVAEWLGRWTCNAINRSRVRILASSLSSATLGKLLTHMCLCHQAVYFGTSQRAVMPCDWEGKVSK